MNDSLAQDASLLQDFLTECDELLQQLDTDLVAIESTAEDAELLNRIFRAFHTVKGTSGFMGFNQVVDLTHNAEDVLNLLRKGERKVTRRTMDVLLAVLDQLRRMLDGIRTNSPKTYDLTALLDALRALQAPQPPVKLDPPRLGEIVVVDGLVSHNELDESLSEARKKKRKIGEVLVEKNLTTPSQVQEALVQQTAVAESRTASARTIRVDVQKLDDLVNLVGELVLERNRLTQLSRDLSQQKLSQEKLEASFSQAATRLSFITNELQVAGLKTRMVPVDMVFRRFPRLVRDIAHNLGKEVRLEIRGEDTEMDKTVVEEINDPLIHLVRNALDHGLEPPDVREASGKPREGTIRLEARQEGDHIVVQVAEDGAGIDPDRIAKKGIEKGLLTPERVRAMTRREILDLIFLPGFSTAEKLSDVSGRGVGMDVVRTNLKKLNGIVELESEIGRGTTVTLRLPLTLAILPVLLVEVAGEVCALPLRSVVETVRVTASDVHRVDGNEILHLRERVIPILRLEQLFGPSRRTASNGAIRVVILDVGERRFGIVVDQLLGQEETVIKPLASYLRHLPGLAGATISGDGRVRLILDPGGLASVLSPQPV